MATTGSSSDQQNFQGAFDAWVRQQEDDLELLLQALSSPTRTTSDLRELVATNLQHYQEYGERRRAMIRRDALSFSCPAWTTNLENSFLWLGGCRPTMSIRLVYVLSSTNLEERLEEYLRGVRRGGLAELSATQLQRVNELQGRTIIEEDMLSKKMAVLQEEIADDPLVAMSRSGGGEQLEEEVDGAIDTYVRSLGPILEEADKLRVGTLKELVGILTPSQGVELLAAAKKMHLRVHEWGIRRDRIE